MDQQFFLGKTRRFVMRVKGHSFFKRVDEMLERRGRFRREIAPLMGCTDTNISQMFTRGALPDIDRCSALAQFLECNPAWLAWGVGSWQPVTEQVNAVTTAISAVTGKVPQELLLEIAAQFAKIPEPVRIEPQQVEKFDGSPNRLIRLEKAIFALQEIQAVLSPRDPMAKLAESQELALWRLHENLKKPQPPALLHPVEAFESGSLVAVNTPDLPSKPESRRALSSNHILKKTQVKP